MSAFHLQNRIGYKAAERTVASWIAASFSCLGILVAAGSDTIPGSSLPNRLLAPPTTAASERAPPWAHPLCPAVEHGYRRVGCTRLPYGKNREVAVSTCSTPTPYYLPRPTCTIREHRLPHRSRGIYTTPTLFEGETQGEKQKRADRGDVQKQHKRSIRPRVERLRHLRRVGKQLDKIVQDLYNSCPIPQHE